MTSLPWADIGSAVSNICMAVFLGNALPIATAGVEQNNPILTLEIRKKNHLLHQNFRKRLRMAEDMRVCKRLAKGQKIDKHWVMTQI